MSWYNPASWFNSNAGKSTQYTPPAINYNKSGNINIPGTSTGATSSPAMDSFLSGITIGQDPAPQTSTNTTNNTNNNTSAPVYHPQDLTQYKNPVIDHIHQLQQAYNLLNGNVDASINDQVNNYNKQYDTQAKGLNDSYINTQGQLGGAYAARGLGQSSFLGDAQNQATNTYNTNNDAITQSRTDTLAGLGKYGAQQHMQNNSAVQQYNDMLNNLGQYDQAEAVTASAGQTGLQNLNNTLQNNLASVNTQAAGLGTNADFVKGLEQFAPKANNGVNELASKLQQVVSSGAPAFAKNAIAQGLVKQAQLTDPNAQSYWNNYYQNLLNSNG